MNRIKTIIAALVMLICIASCTPSINCAQHEPVEEVEVDGKPNCRYKVVDITVNGETHQYLKYVGERYKFGLAHWEGCKYCKAQNAEECEDYDDASDKGKAN